MKKIIFIVFLLSSFISYSQKDSTQISSKYLEDQLYISISYNTLKNQPEGINNSDFSYGISAGFIRDIPFNKNRNFGVGLGLGYGYDSYNHSYKVSKSNNQFIFENGNSLGKNKLTTHNIEVPFEIRWRNSTLKEYDFWRIYLGFKMSYNFSNKFSYTDNNTNFEHKGIPQYNKWQGGLTLSAGYDVFNFYLYYGVTPLLKNASLNTSEINTKVMKFGLTFYIL